MPMHEHLDLKVTIVIEVDDHVLSFSERGRPMGARYHGEEPPSSFAGSELEREIRGTIDSCIAKAHRRANAFVQNSYPIVEDRAT